MMAPNRNEQGSSPGRSWWSRRNPTISVVISIVSGLAVAVMLCCAGFITFLNTAAGHRYLLQWAERNASDAAGVPVRLQNLALHPSTLTVDLYGVRVAGAAPFANLPLFQADHLKVGIRVVSILSRSWYLDQIQLDHPVAWVVVNPNGTSNLPVFKGNGSSSTDLFDLGVRQVHIARGEVYYNSHPHALNADLHDIAFNSVFSGLLKRYKGRLAYSSGKLTFGELQPLEHSLDLEFDATPATLIVDRGTVSVGPSRATVRATVDDYANPTVQAQYQIEVDGKQAAGILKEPNLPVGVVQTAGTLRYRQMPNRSAIESLLVNGTVGSERLTLDTATTHTSLTNLSGSYSLSNGNAAFKGLRASVLGGAAAAEGTVQTIGGNSHSSFHVGLHKVSLAELERSLGNSSLAKGVALHGSADATATATWGRTIDDLIAHADLTLQGNASKSQTESAKKETQAQAPRDEALQSTVPIQGAFHAIYSNANRSLTLNQSYLTSSQSSLSMNGTISRRSSLSLNLEANDLGEVATFIDLFRTPGAGAPAVDLKGRATFTGTIRGSTTSPEVAGQLAAENLEYNGTKWKLLNTGVELSPSRAAVQNLRMQDLGHGIVSGKAGLELRSWSFSRDGAMQLDLNVSGLPTSTIASLAGRAIPVNGTLNVDAHLHGPATALKGSAFVRLVRATAFGEPVTEARIDLTGSGDNVKASASVTMPAGSFEAQVNTDPHARTYNAQLTSKGIDLAKLETLKTRGVDADGVLGIRAHGQGTYDDPAVDADLEIPTLSMNGKTISQTRLRVNEAHHVADVELASSIANAPLHGKAQLHLEGGYQIDGSIDTPAVPLEPLLAAYAPDADTNLSGQVELHASIHGPLKDRNKLQAQIRVPVLKVSYGNSVQLSASPVQADYRDGLIRLQPVSIRGTDTQLDLQGEFPVTGRAPAALKAHGSINLQIAQIFEPDLKTSGHINVNVDSRGTTAQSLVTGGIEVADAGIASATSPVSLQHANGVLKLAGDRVTIEKLDGTLGGGSVSAQGAIIYRPGIQLDLGVAIKDAEILYPQGVRETANASLRLSGANRHAALSGAVGLSNLSFTPAFDLSSVVNQFSGGVEVPQTAGFLQNLQLNVAVNSTNNTSLVSRTLSVDGTANLQIRGTAAQPVVLGRVNLTGGDVILNGNRFVLTGGTVQFINPAMTEPVLNVALTTSIKEYKIDLRFRGPADQLRTQYTSDPSLPPADIINLLAFGQTTEASAMNTTTMNQQAEGLVASQVANQVTSVLSKAAGISQLSISPVIAGGTAAGPPGANLTIRQRVTGNLYVTFSTNVATTQGQVIQGQYQVSPRVTVSATRDPNGGFAFDTLVKKTW